MNIYGAIAGGEGQVPSYPKPAYVIRVSPNFPNSDTRLTYQTINLALSKANELASLSTPVLIEVYDGEFEEDIVVGQNITIDFKNARLMTTSSSDPSLTLNGGVVKNLGFAVTNSKDPLVLVNGFGSLHLVTIPDLLYLGHWTTLGIRVSSGSILAGNRVFAGNCQTSLVIEANASATIVNSNFGDIIVDGNAELVACYVRGQITGSGQVKLISTFPKPANIPDIDVIDLAESTGADSIFQATYLDAQGHRQSIEQALSQVKSDHLQNLSYITQNASNIALLSSQVDILGAGEYSGQITDQFGDNSQVESSLNCFIEDGLAKIEKRITIDDFEAYSSDAELQASWVSDDTNHSQCFLEQNVVYEGDKALRWEFDNSSIGDSILKSLSLDLSKATGVRFAVRTTNEFIKIRVRLKDGNGATADSYPITPREVWQVILVSIDDFIDEAGFDWSNITQLGFVYDFCPADTGSVYIDSVLIVSDDLFEGVTLIDDFESDPPDWTLEEGNPTLSRETADYYSGSACLRATGLSGNFRISNSASGLDGSEYAVRFFVKAPVITSQGELTPIIWFHQGSEVIKFVGESFFPSSDWKEILVPLSKIYLTYTGNVDLTQIDKVEIEFLNSGFEGDLLIDLLEAGQCGHIISVDHSVAPDVIASLLVQLASIGSVLMDVALDGASFSSYQNAITSEYRSVLHGVNVESSYWESGLGEWLIKIVSSDVVKVRIYSLKQAQVHGYSLVWI